MKMMTTMMMIPKWQWKNNGNNKETDLELIPKMMDIVSDTDNVTAGIADMFMDDAPATQLLDNVEAAIKNVVDTEWHFIKLQKVLCT